MKTFEQAAEGMFLAQEGQQQLAVALAAEIKALLVRFRRSFFKAPSQATDNSAARWTTLQQH